MTMASTCWLSSESARLAAVNEKDSWGNTALLTAAKHPESFKMILELLPESARFAAVNEKDRMSETLLHRVVAIYPESLKMILELLPESARFAAVNKKNRLGDTFLHSAASHPELLKMILELYPKSARLAAVNEKHRYGTTVLHSAASHPESLKMILELLPESARFAAVNEKDRDGHNVLQRAARSSQPLASLKAIIDSLSINNLSTLLHENEAIWDAQTMPLLKEVIIKKLTEQGSPDAIGTAIRDAKNCTELQSEVNKISQAMLKATLQDTRKAGSSDEPGEITRGHDGLWCD